MSNLSVTARLKLLLDGTNDFLHEANRVVAAGGDISDQLLKLEKTSHRASEGLEEVGKAAGKAGKDLAASSRDASSAGKEWDALAEKISKAESAYRDAAKANAAQGLAAPAVDDFMRGQGVTSNDTNNYRAGMAAGLLKDEEAAKRASAAIQEGIRKTVAARAAADEKDRQAQWLAVQSAKEQQAAEARVTAELQRQAAMRRNATRAQVTSTPRAGSFLSQGEESGLKASNTSWAQSFQTAQAAADDYANTLPRVRYAMYDVSSSAAMMSAAITGAGVASVVLAAKQESEFTNVERTVDGLSAGAIDGLRTKLLGLETQIPRTFADITDIATLGNQLGIAGADIARFTETTAKFSTVTGLSTEATATAFGSLGNLLRNEDGSRIAADQYENLGSAIAYVGRTSVATEGEIVTMSSRLAASATRAGFTAQEVIALSGALASLRVAPERAQGVMETYFSRLNTAITEQGPALEAFARYAGVATSEVEGLVRTDPVGFFTRLSSGIGQLDNIAQTGALKELGLDGLRAGEVFGRVSANLDIFNKSLNDANTSWAAGSELTDQYGKVVDDLASKWQIFLNVAGQAGAAFGQTLAPALGFVIEQVTELLKGFTAFASTPVGKVILTIVGAIGGLVAGLAALTAAAALGVGSLYALRTAAIAMGASQTASGILGFVAGLVRIPAAAGAATAATGAFAAGLNFVKIALVSTGIGAAVVLLGTIAGALMGAGDAAGASALEIEGMASSLRDAMNLDTTAWRDGAGSLSVITTEAGRAKTEIDGLGRATDKAGLVTGSYAGIQRDVAAGTSEATKALYDQTVALGANSEAWFRNNLGNSEAFKKLATDPAIRAAAESVGFSVNDYITASMKGNAEAYIASIKDKLTAAMAEAGKQTTPDLFGADYDAQVAKVDSYAAALRLIGGELSTVAADSDATRQASLDLGAAQQYAGVAAEESADGFEMAGTAVKDMLSPLFDAQNALLGVENSLFSLGNSLAQNGNDWSQYSENGRANLGALMATMNAIAAQTPNDAAATAANLQALFNFIVKGGYASAQQLSVLSGAIKALAGGKQVQASAMKFDSFFGGIQVGAAKAAKSVEKVREKVVTLVDYANDLGGVMKRAFDIRFDAGSNLDNITKTWRKIEDSVAGAKEEMAEYRLELGEITADRKIKEYWLSVAEMYGDTLRAGKLRAELAELDKKQTDTQTKLDQAQQETNMSLKGNSDAAIRNRGDILQLVSQYQNYLRSLAESGMSQDQLKAKSEQLRQEFIQQAVRMGYNRGEVMEYAGSFDDMSLAIARVPRNITVAADVNPALQALAEFAARAWDSGTAAGTNAGNGFNNGVGSVDMQSAWRPPMLMPEQTMSIFERFGINAGESFSNGVDIALGRRSWKQEFINRNGGNLYTGGYVSGAVGRGFAGGGYTGDGGKYQAAGTVHRGEFVMSKAATTSLGVNGLSLLHNLGKNGGSLRDFAAMLGGGGGRGGDVVTLSASSARMLADLLSQNLRLVLPGAQLAGSVGQHNVIQAGAGRA